MADEICSLLPKKIQQKITPVYKLMTNQLIPFRFRFVIVLISIFEMKRLAFHFEDVIASSSNNKRYWCFAEYYPEFGIVSVAEFANQSLIFMQFLSNFLHSSKLLLWLAEFIGGISLSGCCKCGFKTVWTLDVVCIIMLSYKCEMWWTFNVFVWYFWFHCVILWPVLLLFRQVITPSGQIFDDILCILLCSAFEIFRDIKSTATHF